MFVLLALLLLLVLVLLLVVVVAWLGMLVFLAVLFLP